MRCVESVLALVACAVALAAFAKDTSNVWTINTALWSLLAFLNGLTR